MSTQDARELEPSGYAALLADLKARVQASQVKAVRAANTELLSLYWSIGRDILTRQQQDGWGAKVVDRLAADLREAFPDQRGFSRRNLQYMRAFAAAWPEPAFQRDFVHQAGAQLPWRHITVLLDRLDTPQLRAWYAAAAVEYGWSRNVLEHQIMTGLHARAGAAPSNFATHLAAPESELAQQLTRDPYVFDHLTLTGRVGERELEQALMDRLQQTLTAFGHGMAFVGRQHRLEVGEETLIVDLLLFFIRSPQDSVIHVQELRRVAPDRPSMTRMLKVSTTQGGVRRCGFKPRSHPPRGDAPTRSSTTSTGRSGRSRCSSATSTRSTTHRTPSRPTHTTCRTSSTG
ncbi:PDDEXK nuclease domain-containing protein [Kineococcus sp. SYSU DK018]|uniref:PDDEXK nuclease domain-containing protein n=1 Tax=Kineococcus sp. SYSU DK018 TaxID=3383139 RepID=UPI003D7E1CFB